MLGHGHGNTGHRVAGAAAEVGIVAARMDYPVAPANLVEGNVQLLATALRQSIGTVDIALLAGTLPSVLGVDHDERSIVAVRSHCVLHCLNVARLANDLYQMAEVVVPEPSLYRPLDIDLHPFIWKQRSNLSSSRRSCSTLE